MLYWWTETSKIPKKPGVYAWYYVPEITIFDLQQALSQLQECISNNNREGALEIAENFLNNHIFRYFKEEPYQATLRGSLKPKYEGHIEHKPDLSEELINRIVDEPERLFTIKQILEKSVPNFSSPLYIGMSENLNSRIRRHQKLIEKYYSESSGQKNQHFFFHDVEDRDRSFAMRIFSRTIPPTRLLITVDVLEESGKRYVDIENILNRIHYPLLGRN